MRKIIQKIEKSVSNPGLCRLLRIHFLHISDLLEFRAGKYWGAKVTDHIVFKITILYLISK